MEIIDRFDGRAFPTVPGLIRQWAKGRLRRTSSLETIYCAELVATTYEHMGLLPSRRPASWYDPGRFWSGDGLELVPPVSAPAASFTRPFALSMFLLGMNPPFCLQSRPSKARPREPDRRTAPATGASVQAPMPIAANPYRGRSLVAARQRPGLHPPRMGRS